MKKPQRTLALVFACAMLLATVAAGVAEAQNAKLSPVDIQFFGASPRLSDLLADMPDPVPGQPTFREVPIQVRPGTEDRGRIDGDPDPVWQWDTVPGFGGANPPIVSFDGLNEADNVGAGQPAIVPPDTTGDVSPDHYIQWINLTWRIYDKVGTPLSIVIPGNLLWGGTGSICESTNDGDPMVLWDEQAGRWFMTQFSIGAGVQCIQISQTADPFGSWWLYAFTVTPVGGNDYPKFGVWTDGADQSAYVFTTRDFDPAFNIAMGVLERDAMLNGLAASGNKFSLPCTGSDCLEGSLPPHLNGTPPPVGTCPTFVTYYDAAYDDGPSGVDGVRNHMLCSDWAGGSPTLVENTFVAGAPFDRFLGNGFSACITPTPGEALDCLAAFTMHAANYRWFGTHASMVINTTVDVGGDRGGIRWGELRPADGDTGWSFFQEGTYGPADNRDRWMGSIAMNANGDIALGYSRVSGAEHPSIHYVGRMDGDPIGLMSGSEQLCHQGGGSQTASAGRWGDYSRMSVDPADGETFWYTQEYYATTGSFDFSTRVCSFDLGGGGGGIPCEDIDKFLSRCNPNNSNLQARVKFFDNSHDGEQVTIEVDGVPHVLTIFNNIAGFQQPGGAPGTHTFELVDPAGCFPQNVVTCPGD